MKKVAKSSDLYAFLLREGALDSSDELKIKSAKRRYLAERKRLSKQNIRKQRKSFEVLLTIAEWKEVKRKAAATGCSVTRFIKTAAVSSGGVIAPATVGAVRELLILHRSLLEEVLVELQVADVVLEKIISGAEAVEQQVLMLLQGKNGKSCL